MGSLYAFCMDDFRYDYTKQKASRSRSPTCWSDHEDIIMEIIMLTCHRNINNNQIHLVKIYLRHYIQRPVEADHVCIWHRI